MIVMMHHDPVLVDREALALLTKRSVHTIRVHLEPVAYGYERGRRRALYELPHARAVLDSIPSRRRDVG